MKITTAFLSLLFISLTTFTYAQAEEQAAPVDHVIAMQRACYPIPFQQIRYDICFEFRLDDAGKRIDAFEFRAPQGSIKIQSDLSYEGINPEQLQQALNKLVKGYSINAAQAAFLVSVGQRDIGRSAQDPVKMPISKVEARFARMIISTSHGEE